MSIKLDNFAFDKIKLSSLPLSSLHLSQKKRRLKNCFLNLRYLTKLYIQWAAVNPDFLLCFHLYLFCGHRSASSCHAFSFLP